MATFQDFKSGLQDFNDYISPTHHIDQTLLGDSSFVAVKAELDYNLKDIICALLAGQGLQLPNLQICLSAALGDLLTNPIQGALREALQAAADAMSAFQDHTNIDGVLGRLNGIIDEAAAVGSMINFCAAPVNPVAIPNMIQQAFGSFLGSGNAAINALGNVLPDNLCACVGLDGSFNASSLNAGALKDVFDNLDDILSGNFAQTAIDDLIGSLNSVANDLASLISLEGLINGNYSPGGSSLHQGECSSQFNIPRSIGIGMANPGSTSVSLSLGSASGLSFTFSKLGGYPVIGQVSTMDTRGTKLEDETAGGMYTPDEIAKFKAAGLETRSFKNIFELLVEPEMMDLLKNPSNYEALLTQQQPVYDYCGNIIRYETIVQQGVLDAKSSITTSPDDPNISDSAPGNAGNERSATTQYQGASVFTGDLHPVARTGDYGDLENKPNLGTAAFASSTDFATAAQGTKADTAIQPGSNISLLVNNAGYLVAQASDFATAAQGTKADTAIQPGDNITLLNNNAGYITSFSETDPIFSASPAATITNTNISNWNTAYGWGDHSAAGYIKNYTETDPIFSASPAATITNTNISNWNTAYGWGDHSIQGYLTAGSLPSNILTSDNLSDELISTLINDAGYLTDSDLDGILFDSSLFALASQGQLADTAVQPGDNVSDLVNDVGYLTSIPSIDGGNAFGV